MNKLFFITRLEESRVLKRVDYQIAADNETGALQKLDRMEYHTRETRDELREEAWRPREIIEISE